LNPISHGRSVTRKPDGQRSTVRVAHAGSFGISKRSGRSIK
jgi:lysophospholipid acyltransferase (LPLAT)-like uncharacterized protein